MANPIPFHSDTPPPEQQRMHCVQLNVSHKAGVVSTTHDSTLIFFAYPGSDLIQDYDIKIRILATQRMRGVVISCPDAVLFV